jgi:hypothetical protein
MAQDSAIFYLVVEAFEIVIRPYDPATYIFIFFVTQA